MRAKRFLAFLLVFTISAWAEDWPQILGPRRDGTYVGAIASTWPKEGPNRVWEIAVGEGFAGPAVADGKVFLFQRKGEEEKLECLDAANGKSIWSNGYAATYRDDFGFDPGPRAVPTVANGKVFTYGPDGVISAVNVADGKTVWRIDGKKEFGSQKGFFGRASSPLVFGDLVLLNVGGESGAGVVALHVATGKLRWKASDDEASYSSPTLGVFDGKTNALFLTRSELISIDPENGKVFFKYPFTPRISASVSAATPLVDGTMIFISASYGTGATVLRVEQGKAVKVWAADSVLSNHYATSVHRNGLLFGFDGRQEEKAAFVCVDWKTGKSKWRKEHFGAGTVLLAGDRLLILLETGELILAEAGGDTYKELQRAQVLGSGVRAYPALADGFIYARSKDKLVKLDLRK
jgi:outer membrane protein assembly factor BamB